MKFVLVSIALFSMCLGAKVVLEAGETSGVVYHEGNDESHSQFEGSWQSKLVRYPIDGEYPAAIKYIRIVENMGSTHSTATLKSGGVGSNYATIEYYAPAFRSYDYSVEIRG